MRWRCYFAEITSLAEAVSAAAVDREEDARRTVMQAGLVVARQLAVKIERRTAMAIGAAGVLIVVLAGYSGYEIGSANAGTGPVAVCWQPKNGARVCAPAVWLNTGE
jgi:hypothetical protein